MASGDRASTGRKPKKGAKAKGEKLSQEEQSERFKETARELDADESGEAFERTFRKIVPQKR
jgi:hypothetical protein